MACAGRELKVVVGRRAASRWGDERKENTRKRLL